MLLAAALLGPPSLVAVAGFGLGAALTAWAVGYAILRRYHLFVGGLLVARPVLELLDAGHEDAEDAGLGFAALIGGIFLATAVGWFAVNYAERRLHPLRPTQRAMVVFIGLAAMTVPVSLEPVVSATAFLKLLSGLAMGLLLYQFLAMGLMTRRGLAITLLVSGIVPMIWGFKQMTEGVEVDPLVGFPRLTGTFPHPSPYGTFLVSVMLPALVLLLARRDRIRWYAMGIFALGVIPLVQSYSRAAWLSMALAIFVVGAMRWRWLPFALVAVTALAFFTVPAFNERFEDLDDEHPEEGVPGNSLAWRFGYWDEVTELGHESPWTGHGLDVVPTLTEDELEPHSIWVQLYAETGLVGFVGFGAVLLVGSLELARAVRHVGMHTQAGLWIVIAAGGVVAFLLQASTENFLTHTMSYWYYGGWLAIALDVAAREGATGDSGLAVDEPMGHRGR